MQTVRDPAIQARMELAMELYELAVDLLRHNLPRQFPLETPEQIEARIAGWHRRPVGSPVEEWSERTFEVRPSAQ